MIEDDDKSSRGEESRGKSQEPESRGKSQERESRGKSQDSLEVANEKEEDGREALAGPFACVRQSLEDLSVNGVELLGGEAGGVLVPEASPTRSEKVGIASDR